MTEGDISALPSPVQRYLRFMGVVGRPREWSLRTRFVGRFRLRPNLRWMPADAWQYNSAIDVARLFVMRIRFARIVPMVGVDSYLRGRGHMLGKLLRVVTVAEGAGEAFDIGELTTYLNDAILLAPTFLLTPAVSWNAVDDRTFEVILSDGGRSVSGRVSLDDRGAPLDFRTTDRFIALPGGPRRAEWRTPVERWTSVEGRAWPSWFAALWHLPDGDLPYVEGRPVAADTVRNVPPGN